MAFNPNEAARNRLTTTDDAILSDLCREWLHARAIEFIGGPKCGWLWTMDSAEDLDAFWSYPVGRVVHSYRLCGERYVYCGCAPVGKNQ